MINENDITASNQQSRHFRHMGDFILDVPQLQPKRYPTILIIGIQIITTQWVL